MNKTHRCDWLPQLRQWVNCGMRKVKCGIENAEWRWLVEATNHVGEALRHALSVFTFPRCHETPHHPHCAKYRSWVLVKCVWCGVYYWFRLRKGTGYSFHAYLTCILLPLLLIQCKISLYLGPVRMVWPVRCFVTVQSRFAETRFAETRFAETPTLTLNPNFGETGFGETGFGESGFGETGRHLCDTPFPVPCHSFAS